jgi:lysophospholipase L1-like esterase
VWGVQFEKRHIFPYVIAKKIHHRLFTPSKLARSEIEQRAKIISTFSRPVAVLMVGDSITDHAPWQDMFPAVSIANFGIAGDTVHGISTRVNNILSFNASKVFIMAGVNDLFMYRSVEEILVDYAALVEALAEKGVQVYIQSTILCNTNLAGNCTDILEKIESINAALKLMEKKPNIVYVDLNSQLENNDQLNEIYTYDGVHLNAAGYKVWQAEIAALITNSQ